MTATEQLKHKLMILAGLPLGSPTDSELVQIIADIRQIAKQRVPTDSDWRRVASRYVRDAGRHRYASEDMSDLNALLRQILESGSPGPS
jgi:hypothetical protein